MSEAIRTPAMPFIDLAAQQRALGPELRAAIDRVLAEGRYILGSQVAELERELAAFCGAGHAVACANGTDALVLGLRALGLKPGQAVVCPTFTFCATAEAVALLGAVPVFADVDPGTCNLDSASLTGALGLAEAEGLEAAGVIAVDLFGLPAAYDRLEPLAAERGLWLLADAAQSFGAARQGRRVGTFGDLTTTSFFPAKPLGCYGDGGALLTDDAGAAALLRSLRVHGAGSDKYDNVHVGTNSRLDTLQAAILLVKLAAFERELAERQRIADRYDALSDCVEVPRLPAGATSSWAQYTVLLPEDTDRATVQASLRQRGIPTAVYYGKPLHLQTAYAHFPAAPCPQAERLAARVLSLPMHPYLDEATQDRVITALREALG